MSRGGRALWLALACAVLLRLPALRYDVLSDDEAIYHAMAMELRQGGVEYRETVDHKPPGLASTYAAVEQLAVALGGTAEGLGLDFVHLLGALASAATCLLLFLIARRTLSEPLWPYPPMLYAVVSTAMQPVDGLAVNGELLMNPLVALGLWLSLLATDRSQPRRAFLDLAAGVACGLAVLYKYQAAIALLSLPLLCWPSPLGPLEALRARWPLVRAALARCFFWGMGSLLPLAAVAGFFYSRGALDDALRWGLLFNGSYIAEGAGLLWALRRLLPQLAGVVLPGAVLFGGGALGLWALVRQVFQRKAQPGTPGAQPDELNARLAAGAQPLDVLSHRPWLLGLTLGSAAAVCVGGRFFGHYFLQAELPLALVAAGPAARLGNRRLALGLGLPAALFALIALLPEVTRPIFNAKDPEIRSIGRAIAARTAPADTIWVWGNVPQLYHASARRPGVRFSFCNYLTGLSPGTPSEHLATVDPKAAEVSWAWPLALDDLARRRPELVLDTAAAGLKAYGKFPISRYPLLADYLSNHYERESDIAGIAVWRRRPGR